MRESLTKKERLKRKADITRVFREGKAVRCSGTHLRTADNDLGYNRVAFTCVKRFGNAVERNRAKRVAREIYRKGKSNLKPGHDLVFILYPTGKTYADRDRHIRFLLSEAGLVHDTE